MSWSTGSVEWRSASAPEQRLRLRQISADVAILATIATVAVLFCVSPMLLEHFGVSYLTAGGNPAAKFHPATFLAIAAIAARCLATRHPVRTAWQLVTCERGVVLLLLATLVLAATALLIAKTPVTPLVDTFVLPVLLLLLLRGLDERIVKAMAVMVAAILCANAVMGIAEMVRHTHFVTLDVADGISADPTRADAVFDWRAELEMDWRATALLGHPLVNGLIVGGFMICLAAPGARWLPLAARIPMALLQLAALFAFGARTSMVTAILAAGVLVLGQVGEALGNGARFKPRPVAVAIIALGVAVVGAAVLNETGFFDRMVERFGDDAGSANTRIRMFELFQPIPWDELLLAPNQEVVATAQRLNGLEFGIESSWIGLILNYGLIVTGIVVIGLVTFCVTIVKMCGRGASLVLLFWVVAISVTASISGKTTTFAMLEMLILLFLRKDEPLPAVRPLPLLAAPPQEPSIWDAGFALPYGARPLRPARALPPPRP